MSTKEDYLKRYLTKDDGQKKKSKKKKASTKPIKVSRMKIFDEDAAVPVGGEEVRAEEVQEEIGDNPVVVFVNNLKTDELQMLGKFKVSNWQSLDDETPSVSRENGEKRKRHDSDSDSDSRQEKNDQSPIRRRIKKEPDSDYDPVRRDQSPIRRRARRDSDGDGRSVRRRIDKDQSPVRRRSFEKDHSPIRKRIKQEPDSNEDTSGKKSVRRPVVKDQSPVQKRARYESDSDNGRSDSRHLRRNVKKDTSPIRRHPETIKRQHFVPESKKKREPTEEEKRRAEEMKEKYKVWNKGVKQVKDREDKLKEMAYVAEKPLARYEGDEDLEAHLKDKMLSDDPMLKYMQAKRIQEGKDVRDKPVYRGPPALPNRYGILPGYRWDGVDRSNGFEQKLLSQTNIRKAEQDDFYQWSSGHQD